MKNLDRIDIKASTGNGKVSESIWIAFLDQLLTKSKTNKTTTQKDYI